MMPDPDLKNYRKVLIVSSHPLFGMGIRRLLQSRPEADARVVGIVQTVDEASVAMVNLEPDLVVVDYDDEAVNREEFLARFVEGEKKLRVVLLSLKEGGSEAIIYDRRSMAASQIDDWLKEWVSQAKHISPEYSQMIEESHSLNRRIMRKNLKHVLGALILVVVLTVVGVFLLTPDRLLPLAASRQAVPVDNLFKVLYATMAFMFALIVGFMLYSIIVFRRKKGDLEDASHVEGNTKLEVTWTIIPLIVVIGFAMLGSRALADTQRLDAKPLQVKVIGQQWSWRFEYPELGITSDSLVLPLNKQVLLKLISMDVIHSFWVPEFRLKQDAIPDSERVLRVNPTVIGEYSLICAEMCGKQHAYMNAPVSVRSQEDFDAWVVEQQSVISSDPVVRGEKWYSQYGCVACHTLDGATLVGPSFQGIFGEEVTFTDGTSTVVDDAYLFESIRTPDKNIVEGFQNVMPVGVAESLTDEQVNDLIEFIKSIE